MKSTFFLFTWALSYQSTTTALSPQLLRNNNHRIHSKQPNSFSKLRMYRDDFDHVSTALDNDENEESAFLNVDDNIIMIDDHTLPLVHWEGIKDRLPVDDPASLEISNSKAFEREAIREESISSNLGHFPVAMMMQDCAPFIAAHAGKTMVIHIPGNILTSESEASKHLLSDIVTSYLLGMKIVIVLGCQYDSDSCPLDFTRPHECHNALKVVTEKDLRSFEEEAGFLRTEIERKLNRQMHVQGNGHKLEGNIVSGNFYTAQRYGRIRGQDFQYAGYVNNVHPEKINKVLADNDIVLLSTVGLCRTGDLVNVNGYHLAASVAASLNCYKLVYLAHEGSILHKKDGGPNDIIQELPLSYAHEIVEYNNIKVHPKGFANFDEAREELDPRAVEFLLHLGWAGWALENGVKRAHIVNPTDGALLEELFTSTNGANTCLFKDDELEELEEEIAEEEWDNFFHSAKITRRNSTSTVAFAG